MIRGNNQITTARIAICAALLCGSSAAFAQEAAVTPAIQLAPTPVAAAPIVAPPAPVVETTTVVAPPPAVATIPPEKLAKPATTGSRRAAPTAAVRPSAFRSEAAQPQRAAEQPTAAPIDPTARMTAPIEDSLPTTSTVEDTAAIAPVTSEARTTVDANDDNMIVVGGISAALGLAGLGAVLARRRRRPVEQRAIVERTETIVPVTSETPAFAKPIATAAPIFTSPVVSAEAEPIKPAVFERAAPRFMPSATDSDLPLVTDPLFSHQVKLGPITDPLFSHKAELAPVTDPMFADRDDFMDSGSPSSAFDKRRSWPSAPDGSTTPVRELEPAE